MKEFLIANKKLKENATGNLKDRIQLFQNEVEEEKSDKIEPWFELGKELLKMTEDKNQNLLSDLSIEVSIKFDENKFYDQIRKRWTFQN